MQSPILWRSEEAMVFFIEHRGNRQEIRARLQSGKGDIPMFSQPG